jgi:hypothetical protein
VLANSESIRCLHTQCTLRGWEVLLTTLHLSLVANGTLRHVYEDSLVLALDGGHEMFTFLSAIFSISAVCV